MQAGEAALSPDDLFARAPDAVSIYEVSPRDGLQNETAMIPIEGKRRLIEALVAAGLKRLEITSFVSPKWIPQLADAEELAKSLTPPPGVTYAALCPNARGLERALGAGVKEVAVFLSSSETHNKMNINKTIADTLAVFEEIVPPAREAGVTVRAYLSTVWGCPYEGPVDAKKALGIAQRLLDALERHAVGMGLTTLQLDTNRSLKEARALYVRNGYREIARYNDNPYADHWFEKRGLKRQARSA